MAIVTDEKPPTERRQRTYPKEFRRDAAATRPALRGIDAGPVSCAGYWPSTPTCCSSRTTTPDRSPVRQP